MKIIIPFSGGINSTYMAYRFLTETDHEIVCIYGRDQHHRLFNDAAKQQEWEDYDDLKATTVADWLKKNSRNFVLEKIDWSFGFDRHFKPIRFGFTNPMSVNVVETRYHGYADMMDSHPDASGLAIGVSLENTGTDLHQYFRPLIERDGVDIYLAGVRDLVPVSKGDDFDYDEVAKTMIGRFEQLDFLPDELKTLVAKGCPTKCVQADCNLSTRCGYQRCYDELDKTGAELDDLFARYGSYGKYRHEADPRTYVYRGNPIDKIAELFNYKIQYEPPQ